MCAEPIDLAEAKRRLFDALRKQIDNQQVLQAMERIPRERFVAAASARLAYEDLPLPIGQGQTISQPYIVALMTSALELKETGKVLEIGTGSGYQAAILAELAGKVITVERVPALAESARALLLSLGYGSARIEVRLSGETLGCPEEAPFDAIIVTAGAPKLPRELLDQMAPGGRLVIPIGSLHEQELMKVTRGARGYSLTTLGPCRFVPLVGKGAWEHPPDPSSP